MTAFELNSVSFSKDFLLFTDFYLWELHKILIGIWQTHLQMFECARLYTSRCALQARGHTRKFFSRKVSNGPLTNFDTKFCVLNEQITQKIIQFRHDPFEIIPFVYLIVAQKVLNTVSEFSSKHGLNSRSHGIFHLCILCSSLTIRSSIGKNIFCTLIIKNSIT